MLPLLHRRRDTQHRTLRQSSGGAHRSGAVCALRRDRPVMVARVPPRLLAVSVPAAHRTAPSIRWRLRGRQAGRRARAQLRACRIMISLRGDVCAPPPVLLLADTSTGATASTAHAGTAGLLRAALRHVHRGHAMLPARYGDACDTHAKRHMVLSSANKRAPRQDSARVHLEHCDVCACLSQTLLPLSKHAPATGLTSSRVVESLRLGGGGSSSFLYNRVYPAEPACCYPLLSRAAGASSAAFLVLLSRTGALQASVCSANVKPVAVQRTRTARQRGPRACCPAAPKFFCTQPAADTSGCRTSGSTLSIHGRRAGLACYCTNKVRPWHTLVCREPPAWPY